MSFRNAGIRAALVLGLAIAVVLAVAASLPPHPIRSGDDQTLPVTTFSRALLPPPIGLGPRP